MILNAFKCFVVCLGIFFFMSPKSDGQLQETHLHRADRAKWDQILKTPSDCQTRFARTGGADDEYSGVEFDRIDKSKTLVIVDCYPGAYQPGVILYLMKEHPSRDAELLTLDGIDPETDLHDNQLPYQMFDGFVHFRRATSTLEILQKYRGLGDCGRFLRYRYAKGSFSLDEVREQECATTGKLGSTDYYHWPVKRRM